MYALLFSLAIFGQADAVLPPVPAATPPAPTPLTPAPAATTPDPAVATPAAPAATPGTGTESIEELKTWLLTRLIVDLSFDTQKATEVSKMLDTLSDREVRVLIGVYKAQAAKRDSFLKNHQVTVEQQTADQAKLNLQQAESYRDHLKREYDRQILQGYMTQNLNYQNLVNNQRFLYQPYSSFSYTPGYGYNPYFFGGPYGNFSGAAYGAPVYGGPLYYGNPYYGGYGGIGF